MDITNRSTIERASEWCQCLNQYISGYPEQILPIGLLFTKRDLIDLKLFDAHTLIRSCIQNFSQQLPFQTPIFTLFSSNATVDDMENDLRIRFIENIINAI